jgi:hypothetical protein
LLKLVSERGISVSVLQINFSKVAVVPLEEALAFAEASDWAKVDDDGDVQVTEKGNVALSATSGARLLRQGIYDYAESSRPTWLSTVSRGRAEALVTLPAHVAQCIREADVGGYSAEVLDWWDRLSEMARSDENVRRLMVGRVGERLTCQYEWERVGVKPVWQAIESNLSGYDVLSRKAVDDPTPLAIEVKSSVTDIRRAVFYLSRAEWDVLKIIEGCVLHLWSLESEMTQLAVIPAELVEVHLPQDSGAGTWQRASVPFSVFHGQFAAIDTDGFKEFE